MSFGKLECNFFKAFDSINAHIAPKSANTSLPEPGLTNEIKNAFRVARTKYEGHYQRGDYALAPSGYFSKLNHGPEGQDRAKKFVNDMENSNDIESLLQTFMTAAASAKSFDNHSYFTYVLHELNVILTSRNLPSCRPSDGRYNLDIVYSVVEFFKSLEEQENNFRPSAKVC